MVMVVGLGLVATEFWLLGVADLEVKEKGFEGVVVVKVGGVVIALDLEVGLLVLVEGVVAVVVIGFLGLMRAASVEGVRDEGITELDEGME